MKSSPYVNANPFYSRSSLLHLELEVRKKGEGRVRRENKEKQREEGRETASPQSMYSENYSDDESYEGALYYMFNISLLYVL